VERGFKARAERLALEERRRIGLTNRCRLDPRDLASAHGVHVAPLSGLSTLSNKHTAHLHETEPSAFSGVTVVSDEGRLIVVNDAHTPERQANTIAHELAHCLLEHPPTPLFGRFGRELNKDHEDEADWYAGCLLVPGPGIEATMRLSGHDLVVAANHYGISLELMRWRHNSQRWRGRRAA
jgi:Zn-dependent peptidase ImmA (M78 family)